MNRLKLAVIAGGALFAAPVLAQDADPSMGGDDASGDMSAGGEMGTEGAPMEGTPTEATPTDTAVPMTAWSRSLIDRPYVLGKGKIAAYAQYGILHASSDDGMGNSVSFDGDAFGIGGAYGINEKI